MHKFNLYPFAAQGVLIQRGGNYLDQALFSMPRIISNPYLDSSLKAWLGDPSLGEYLVLCLRDDGRGMAYGAADLSRLMESVMPYLFSEFHARRERCSFEFCVAPDVNVACRLLCIFHSIDKRICEIFGIDCLYFDGMSGNDLIRNHQANRVPIMVLAETRFPLKFSFDKAAIYKELEAAENLPCSRFFKPLTIEKPWVDNSTRRACWVK